MPVALVLRALWSPRAAPITNTRGATNETPTQEAAVWHRSRILAFIALGILPLVLLAAANLWRQVQEGEQRVTEDRVALARAAALTVSGFIDTSFATLQTLAATPTVADPTPRPELSALLDKARETDSPLAVIGLFRPDGWNVALAGRDQPPLTLNVLDRQYVQTARASSRPVVSPATIPRNTGILTVDLVIPVDFVPDGRGVLLGSLALTRLGDQLRALPGSDTVQIVLVDTDGQVILHPDPNVVRSVTSLRGRPEVDAVLAGQTGSRSATGSDGSEDLVAFAPVPTYGWGILVVQPAATAFAQVQRDVLLATGLLISILVLVGLVGWLLGGRLQSAYTQLVDAKTQAEAAQAQAESAQQRLAFLAEGSRILGASLEDGTTLEQVVQLAVPTLGEVCAIDLVDREASDATASRESRVATSQPIRTQLATSNTTSLWGAQPEKAQVEGTRRRLSAEAIATGHLTKQEAHTGAELVGVSVPLLAGGRVLGAFTCVRMGTQPYDEADISLAAELAQRVALAVDNVGLYRAAQRAIDDRDEFLSVAAHELKTPITSLSGYAQLALRRLDNQAALGGIDIRKPLEVIEIQSRKLTRLIGQLLDVSRLEAGRLRLTRERVDLQRVVESLVERTRMMSDRHTVILDASPTPIANIDLLRMEQVLTNLLDNAIKYSPQGGEIRVSLSSADERTVCIAIEDEGVGIPPERREHIFERFYQAHGELLPGMAGMGLGLYISRQILELHGGTIEAEFPARGGVRFVILLPIDSSSGASLSADPE